MFTKNWRALSRKKIPGLDEVALYPEMTHWFDPVLLVKLLWRVIVSALFGQYADRRLMVAALDPSSNADIAKRDDLTAKLAKDGEGAVWIDFVADLGDGFDSTYAIAFLLAQRKIQLDGGTTLPRAGALFMGGDEVYPTATRDEYNVKLRAPYQFAFPLQESIPDAQRPPVFAIPGNHDWYDGLVNFLAFFARKKSTDIGHWKTQQKRSYFAAKVSDLCWVWAIDIALITDMDQPQADYFVAVAETMPPGANVILCSAEPGWYKVDSDSYRTLSYAAMIAENAGKALRIPLVLSGDTHHYARYSSGHGTQYITSGGGGAFLHGTHHLPEQVTADWRKFKDEKLDLQICHPSKEKSKDLLTGNFAFALTNYSFSVVLGGLYAAIGYILTLVPRVDLAVILFGALAVGFVGYSTYQEKFSFKVVSLSLLHSLVHFSALLILANLIVFADAHLWSLYVNGMWWTWLLEFAIAATFAGGLVAGTIFGANLFVTCRYWDMNHNDAFGAMRLNSYRHFLRMKIIGDRITVFPIGIDGVPQRSEWEPNPDDDPAAPYFLPPDGFNPRLLEDPIVIFGSNVSPTIDIKKPSEMPQA